MKEKKKENVTWMNEWVDRGWRRKSSIPLCYQSSSTVSIDWILFLWLWHYQGNVIVGAQSQSFDCDNLLRQWSDFFCRLQKIKIFMSVDARRDFYVMQIFVFLFFLKNIYWVRDHSREIWMTTFKLDYKLQLKIFTALSWITDILGNFYF